MTIEIGTYVAPDGKWYDIESIAIHEHTQEELVIYMDLDKQTGQMVTLACPMWEVKMRGWRPIREEDYGPGGRAEYYKEYGGS